MIPKPLRNTPASNEIEVSLFGPGYGECIAVHIGAGEWIVIDSCKSSETGRPAVLDYLDQLSVDVSRDVSFLICSHWHDDHIRGFGELAERCKSAKVVCSGALRSEEFLNLAAAYSDSDRTLMKSPGAKEIYSTFHQLKVRNSEPIWAAKDRIIVSRNIESAPGTVHSFKIASLSPSDYSITAAKLSFNKLLPREYEPKRGLGSQNPNHFSVVTYIEIGPIGILLGGDLEVTGNKESGWDSIINDRQILTRRSSVYKAAHHGSENGHHNSIWSDMLTNEPVCIITPFRNGRIFLPQPRDINRLVSMRGSGFITASPGVSGKIRRSRAVERTIGETVRAHAVGQPQTGQIQIRRTVDESGDWMVRLSDSAYELRAAETLTGSA